MSQSSPSAPLTSHVQSVTEEDTGGHCMVTFVTLADGRVLGINDECVVLYPSMDAFYDHSEDLPVIELLEGK